MFLIVLGLLVSWGNLSPLLSSSSSTTIASRVINSPFQDPLTNSETFMSSLEACDLLQDLSEEVSSQDDESPETAHELDKLKAQKLLYYAQGYFLAILEKKIFNDPIEAWNYGPAVRTLHDNWKQIKGISLPKGVFKKARRLPEDITITVQEIKAFLRTVIDMFINFSGKDLIDKTHEEAPWREAYGRFLERQDESNKSNEQILPQALISFFRKPGQLFSFLSAYIRVNSEPRKIRHIIDRVRFIISHSYYTTQEIDELYRAFLNPENRTLIDSIYTNCRDNVAWLNLDRLDCVIGYIFLPQQCEQLYEHFPVYLQFGRIRRLLTLSARHGHPLAHAYLNRILTSYKIVEENLDENKEPAVISNPLDDTAKQALTTYLNPSLSQETLCPALYIGLLRLKFGQAAYSIEYFEKGYHQENALCAYYYALRTRQHELIVDKNFVKLLNSYNEGLLPFLEAELATDQMVRFEKYCAAGEKGLPEGFFLAALIFDQLPSQSDVPSKTSLYLRSGQKGFLAGYEKALEMLLKLNKTQEAYDICNELKILGSTYGFALLGKSLRGEDAKNALRLATLIESYPSLRRFETNEQAYERNYRNELEREYNKLRIDANYEQLSPDEL